MQFFRDTAPSQLARYHEGLRRMTTIERAAAIDALCAGVRELCEAGVRMRHPRADEREVRVRVCVRIYGRAIALRLFGAVPDDAR